MTTMDHDKSEIRAEYSNTDIGMIVIVVLRHGGRNVLCALLHSSTMLLSCVVCRGIKER